MTERGLVRRLRARLPRGERGFTMIEVAIALVIFGTLILAIATTQSSTMNLIRTDRHRTVAANLASDRMDTIRATPFTDLTIGRTEIPRDIDGIEYTVVQDLSWVVGDADSGPCDAPADAEPRYVRADVFVSWPVMSGVDPVSSHTVLTPPVGTYDEASGHLAVRVLDRDGAGASGVTITLTPAPPPPTPASQVTTADGCAFFAYLPAGSYTATATATGYVSDEFDPAPGKTSSVVVGGTTSVVFQYDAASSLYVTLVGKDVGAPAPASVGLTIANSHILPTGTLQVAGSGATRTIADLFPFADGYAVWAGTCADASSGEPPAAVDPGAMTAVTVLMPEVVVSVVGDDGTGVIGPLAGVSVSATHAADGTCTAGESFFIGATDENGQLAFALPYGTWDVNVGGASNSVVLSPIDPPADLDGAWPYNLNVLMP